MPKAKETKVEVCCPPSKWHHNGGAMGGFFGFLTFVGAAVYFIQQASGFWMGVLGVLKAIVWPAILIYEVFTRLNL